MPKHAAILVIGAVLTASASAATRPSNSLPADQNTIAQTPSAPTLIPPDSRKNPYGRLFTTTRDGRRPAGSHQVVERTPSVRNGRVVCGTIVIPADPSVDRKIVIPIPESAKDSRIRVVEPPPCSRQ